MGISFAALFFIALMTDCTIPTQFYKPSSTVLPENRTITPLPAMPNNPSIGNTVQTVTRSWSAQELLARKQKKVPLCGWRAMNSPSYTRARQRRCRSAAAFSYPCSRCRVFAAAMGLRHPDTYGHTLAFSIGIEPGNVIAGTKGASEFYLVTGTLEEGFYNTTAGFAQMLRSQGVTYVFRECVCGHDYIMWQEEFPAAVEWAFGHP
jgi:hypothetical protein